MSYLNLQSVDFDQHHFPPLVALHSNKTHVYNMYKPTPLSVTADLISFR